MKYVVVLLNLFAFAFVSYPQTTTGWTLIWSDEFTQPDGSSPNPMYWTNDIGGHGFGNNELQYYTSRTNNVRIENNHLVIEARQENYMGRTNTSARIKTQDRLSWVYGRMEARIKIPRGQGIWPAFWTLGTNITSVGWPNCGEIDILENIGREPHLLYGTIHGPGYSGGDSIGRSTPLPNAGIYADDFHVYAVEWTTNQIKWFRDGEQYFSANPASLPNPANWAFTQRHFLILNVAVGGIWPGYPDATTVYPQRMLVDYVRVYAPTNLPSCGSSTLTNAGIESGSLANWTTYGANNYRESIRNFPVHNGSNVYKVFGQFSGGENFSGIFQDRPASSGEAFTAHGWAFTMGNDKIAGANSAWVEVAFRDAGANKLALYRTALVTTNTLTNVWVKLVVTNQLDPVSNAVIGSVTNLVAPVGTTSVRYQTVFRQLANAGGSVLFDDLHLGPPVTAEFPVSFAATHTGNNLNLEFPTYLNLPYQIKKTEAIGLPSQPYTNVTGNGLKQSVSLEIQQASGFFRVVRPCE